MSWLNPKSEPIVWAGVARVLVLVALRFGIDLDPDTIIGLMGMLEMIVSAIVRGVEKKNQAQLPPAS